MDLVYPYRDSTRNKDDLRYSLRSVELYAPDAKRVFIAGHCPPWLQNVVHVKVGDIGGGPERDQLNKLKAVVEHPDIGERFIWMNDDFYLLSTPHWRDRFHLRALRSDVDPHYHEALERARALLYHRGMPFEVNCEVHMPMMMETGKVRDMLGVITNRNIAFRSVYGNLFPGPSTLVEDVKLTTGQLPDPSWWCFSSDDYITRDPAFRSWMDARYPVKSRWEW